MVQQINTVCIATSFWQHAFPIKNVVNSNVLTVRHNTMLAL